MKFVKLLVIAFIFGVVVEAKEVVHINFSNMQISDFVRFVAKATHKNILLTTRIVGKVEFISSAPVYKEELFNLLLDVLDAKGFTLVEDGSYYKVVRSTRAVKEGLDFTPKTPGVMRTAIIRLHNSDARTIAVRVRQFLSIGGKILELYDINTLIISDYPKNIRVIKKIVQLLDEDANKKEIRFIRLKHTKVARILSQVVRMARATINQKIPSNKVEVLSNESLNSLILIATKENIEKLLPYIKKLDAEDESVKPKVAVIPLQNAEAKNVVKIINTLLAKKKYLHPEDKPLISIDEEMNSLVVSAKGEDIEMIKQMVAMLDTERPQVFIQAKIVEISEQKVKRLGMKYGLEGAKASSNGFFSALLNLGGSSIALSQQVASFVKAPSDLSEGVALGAVIDFLNTEGAAEILSEPSILCVNNQDSSIYVGKVVSVLQSSVQGSSTTDLARNTYKREDIGLTLKIKPRISSENMVTIKTTLVQEDVAGGQPGLPDTTKRQVVTSAIVRNGESVILGGLIKAKYDDKETKVPLLGDIPLFGELFKNREKLRDKVNLVVILTPYIVKNSADMQKLREKLYRLNLLEERYYEILKTKLKEKVK